MAVKPGACASCRPDYCACDDFYTGRAAFWRGDYDKEPTMLEAIHKAVLTAIDDWAGEGDREPYESTTVAPGSPVDLIARAVLSALRNPTPNMLLAIRLECGGDDDQARDGWNAALDAAVGS